MDSKSIYTSAFQNYKSIGLDPLPIPHDEDGHPTKGPKRDGWQTKARDGEYTDKDFDEPCNIGVLLGGAKNLTDIDCDSAQAVAIAGDILGQLMQKTGTTMMFGRASKPRSHYVFFCDKSRPTEKITDPTDKQCLLEYRCVNEDGERGQQTVFPPSLRFDAKDGTTEQVRLESDSSSVPVPVSAAKLHDCFRMIGTVALLSKHFPVEAERHNTILALAGIFARAGMPLNRASTIVKLAYHHSAGYNGDLNKAQSDVKSVYKAFEKGPTTHLFGYPKLTEIMPRAVVDKVLELLGIERPDSHYNLTDTGNGRRLVDKHKDDVRYCADEKAWYVWDGVRWRKDQVNRMRELAKAIAADLRNEAHAMKPPKSTGSEDKDKAALTQQETRRGDLLKWANQSENADRVSKTIISAASDERIICFRSAFDQQSHLLNCPNCVVNLYTGETMPHDRKLMMSNLCPVEYEPNATHPTWDASLEAFTRKHPDLPAFLKRVAGYSIQGEKTEERILILFGPGKAGKGTFMDWLTNALGPDYSCAMDSNSVLKQKRNSAAASGDVLRLAGKRLVVVSEIEKGSRMQESFMKQASGNDALVARGLYESEYEFRPTHQFWFQTNYRPGFDSTDSGNKRRYVEIPFDNDLSTDQLVTFDRELKIKMRQDAAFLKAVLAWCVQGCIEWRKNGLGIPASVTNATEQLFAHNDFLKDFLTEMCVADPAERVPVKDLWDAYEDWCEGQGEEPAQGRTFNRMMEERGFERKQARIHSASAKAWIGIRLKEHDELVGGLGDAVLPGLAVPAVGIKKFPPRSSLSTAFDRKMMAG